MHIEQPTVRYNSRREGQPWIALITFGIKGDTTFSFGSLIGRQHGEPGLLVVNAEPGDIVATGQKDYRKSRNSAPQWHQVGKDGSLIPVADKVTAYRLSQERYSVPPERAPGGKGS